MAMDDPEEIKRAGRQIRNYDDTLWDAARYTVVLEANLRKFGQDPALAGFLAATRDKVLVEASPVDSIWGIGVAEDAGVAATPARWPGRNLLGFALMEVRDKLGRLRPRDAMSP